MATQVKRRRGTTAENDNFTGAMAEFTFDTETHHIRVHDGVKQGGYVIPVITDPLNPGKYTKVTIDDQGLVIGAEPLSVDDLPNEIPMDKVFGLPLALENKQDKIYAGENIVIDETTISAIDTKYTAGEGIFISPNNVISSLTSGVSFDDIIVKSATMPAPEDVSLGSIYMYIGETNTEFVHGYIYQNVKQDNLVVWERMDVQPGGEVSFANLIGQPEDNAALKQELDSKQDVLTAGNGVAIDDNVISTNTQFVITEDMFDIEFDATKGVAPYSTSYGYTNVTIHDDAGIEWVEGAMYSFVLDTKVSTSANRNVRVRIGESGDWKPVMVTSSIAAGSSVFVKAVNSVFFYKTTYQANGALHCLYDTNTTYTINYSIDAGQKRAGAGSYAVSRYSLIMEKPDGTWEKITDTSKTYSTGTSKAVNKRGFLLNQIRYYNYTTNYANGALISASYVYSKSASVNGSYSFNCGTAPGWAIGTIIYLVGTVNENDGLFYLDETQWWSTSLPTTNDGKLYIQLGVSLSASDSTFTLWEERPIFYYDNGIKVYGGGSGASKWGKIGGTLADQTDLQAALDDKQDVIDDLEEIRSNAQAGKDIIPQVEINTQRIEDLTVARFPNVIIVGTPHIEGGQVSNYSDTNYLQFPFVDISRGQPFDIYFSFTTAADVTTQQNILDAHFGIALAIQNGKGIMALSSNGTSWDIGTAVGTNALLPNTTYYVKYSWTGTEYSAALSTNDTEYVPDMNLTSSLSPYKTTIFIGGSPNLFGPASAHPFKGTINFNKSKVVVNGITVWEGMADVGLASRANVSLNNLDAVGEARFTEKQDVTDNNLTTASKTVTGAINEVKSKVDSIAASKFPNAVVIGDLTINHGQIIGFSQTSYLAMPFMFNTQNKGFEFHYAFRTNETDVTTPQNLFGSKFCIASYVSAGKLRIRISNNGTSWDALDIETSLNVQANTTYYIKLESNLLSYTISASTDGVAYNQIGYQVTTLQPKPGDVFIGIGNNNNNPFLGMIDLNKWWLKIAGETIWEGMGESGLSTRADISLSNLDEEGQVKVDSTKNQNEASDIDRLYDWVGTLEEYNEQQIETLHPEWMVYITDDVFGGDTVYTKEEVDAALNEKADKATTLSGYGITNAYTKGEVDTALNNKANKTTTLSGYGITNAYTKTESDKKFINTGTISNCITEIPQDIKLELNNGTLTLKAGSKVYVPNGSNVFDLIITTQDCSMSGAIGANNTKLLIAYKNNSITTRALSLSVSGPGATTTGGFAFDTTANKIHFYNSSGVLQSSDWSFPVAIVSTDSSGVASSIDQVFNGFGYIGSTAFALPGVKGLIPNGRNEDGSLKSNEFTVSRVLTTTDTSGATGGLLYHVSASGIYRANFEYFSYDEASNYNKNSAGVVQYGAIIDSDAYRTNGTVTKFRPKTAFRALDYNDTGYIAHQSMLSNRYIDLTLSTTTYTAPADGWFFLNKTVGTANTKIEMYNANTNYRTITATGGLTTTTWAYCSIPANKGDSVQVTYTVTGTTNYFRFIYANGSK